MILSFKNNRQQIDDDLCDDDAISPESEEEINCGLKNNKSGDKVQVVANKHSFTVNSKLLTSIKGSKLEQYIVKNIEA